MRVLLDTVAVLFAVESPDRLSTRAKSEILDGKNSLEISAISIAEIAIKSTRGKLHFSSTDVEQAIDQLKARVLPFTADHALQLFQLPLHHTDPFDRQLIAQAISEDIPIASPDRDFSLYKGLRVVW